MSWTTITSQVLPNMITSMLSQCIHVFCLLIKGNTYGTHMIDNFKVRIWKGYSYNKHTYFANHQTCSSLLQFVTLICHFDLSTYLQHLIIFNIFRILTNQRHELFHTVYLPPTTKVIARLYPFQSCIYPFHRKTVMTLF